MTAFPDPSRARQQASAVPRPPKLTPPQIEVLGILAEHGGKFGLKNGEIRAHRSAPPGGKGEAPTRTLASLVSSGYVNDFPARDWAGWPDPLYKITDQGRDALRAAGYLS